VGERAAASGRADHDGVFPLAHDAAETTMSGVTTKSPQLEAAITAIAGVTAVVWPDDEPLTDGGEALLGTAFGTDASWVVLPAGSLPDGFFVLSTGVAGALLQRLVTYRFRVAVVGDIEDHLGRSGALRDFVGESNRGRQVWFLPDLAAFETRLTGP
jgi:hypothetical protein